MIQKIEKDSFVYWQYVDRDITLFCFSFPAVLEQLKSIYGIEYFNLN